MNTKVTYGLYLAIVGIVMQLIGYLLGAESGKQNAGIMVLGVILWLVGVAIFAVVLWLGVRAVRDERDDQLFTYGQAFGAGILIVLVASVIGAIYTFIHFSFVNPEFADRMMEAMSAARQQWERSGMTEDKIEMMEKMMAIIYSPVGMAVIGAMTKIFGGVIVSLIVAAIVKRKPSAQTPMTVPPAMP